MMSLSQGPRDNNNFRHNASLNAVDSSITYEGILNEYSYGIGEEFEHLFNTSYSSAIAKNVEGKLEHYLCLEMKSKLDGDGLARNGGRPPMNFSFVLDVSGSMNSSFSRSDSKSKLAVAQECLINLLSKLQPKDQFGLILFTETATVLVPMCTVGSSDISNIKAKILEAKAGGGTKIMAGMNAADEMLRLNPDKSNSINRIFFLTDMNPQDDVDIVAVGHKLSKQGIYISIIGIGVDFNSDLAYKFAAVKGCNCFSVSSAAEFRKQMNEDFDYTSMLICYDVSLKLAEGEEFAFEESYGSPSVPDTSIGEVLKLDSVCPSPPSREGGIKGGIVVLKLKRKDEGKTNGEDIHLNLSYKDWNDKAFRITSAYKFPDDPKEGEYFENNSARKAVALVRYVKLVKQVLKDKSDKPKNKQLLTDFKAYLSAEIAALQDTSMEKELETLETLIKAFDENPPVNAANPPAGPRRRGIFARPV